MEVHFAVEMLCEMTSNPILQRMHENANARDIQVTRAVTVNAAAAFGKNEA